MDGRQAWATLGWRAHAVCKRVQVHVHMVGGWVEAGWGQVSAGTSEWASATATHVLKEWWVGLHLAEQASEFTPDGILPHPRRSRPWQ
jgi:hypothetical protein